MLVFSINRESPSFAENTLGFIVAPAQGAVTKIGKGIGGIFGFFGNISELEKENRNLREEIERLQERINILNLVDERNAQLNELFSVDRKYSDYPKVGAEIIAKDVGNWYDIFIINKGTKDGFSKNMVVLASGGLAGRITVARYNNSTVVSVIDDTSAISARSARTGDTGSVRGDVNLVSDGLCRMEFIDAEADIVPGDEIITSHLSSIYPPGITIGSVVEVRPDPYGMKYAIIKPAVNFRKLETVLVITQLFEKVDFDDVE